MKIHRFENPKIFYQTVIPYLLQNEGENVLPIGICERLMDNPKRYDSQLYLAAISMDDEIVAAAILTPPHNLVLSKIKDLQVIELIAKDLVQHQGIPGVSGLTNESQTFATLWKSLTGKSYRIRMNLKIHQLKQVNELSISDGYLRLATEKDKSLLCQWYEDFSIEAGIQMRNIKHNVENQLKQQTAFLWENQVPVTMVGCAGRTNNSKRLGPVYTPPHYRCNGYATSCVARLSEKFLNEGSQSCFLFTDVSNPTSNHIYHKIGYRAFAEWDEYEFQG